MSSATPNIPHRRRGGFLSAILVALLLPQVGCKIAEVKRGDEIYRFNQYLGTQSTKLSPQVQQPLAMSQCEQIALANSLELTLQRMTVQIGDDNVRLAFTGALPKVNATYTNATRSNDNVIKQGGTSVKVADRQEQNLSVQGTVPILDWGLTYYSYQIAKDQRAQDELLLKRSIQLLIRDVRIAYADHAGALRQEQFLAQALGAGQEVLRVAQSLQRAGETVHADTALITASVAQAEVDVAVAQKKARETHLALAQLMSLPPAVDFTISPQLADLPQLPTAADVTAFEDRALVARPELAQQDLSRHISGYVVRQRATAFFPRLDGIGGFNWTGNKQVANPSWFTGGAQVSYGLLNGGGDIFRYTIAKKQKDIESARTLLVSLGVLFEVEMRALRVKETSEVMRAAAVLETAREAGMKRVVSLYKEGLEDEAGAARALADLTTQATALDRAQTDYLIAWYELEAAVLPERSKFNTAPTTRPATLPTTMPTSANLNTPTQARACASEARPVRECRAAQNNTWAADGAAPIKRQVTILRASHDNAFCAATTCATIYSY